MSKTIKTVESCPLGHTCEHIVDGEIHRCAWYITLTSIPKNDPEKGVEESKCAIVWDIVLTQESIMAQHGTHSSVDSLRNETTRRQDNLHKLVSIAQKRSTNTLIGKDAND